MTVPSRAEAHDRPICGATTRAGTPCRRPAGWGTANAGNETRVGVGRCKLHGGRSPVRHGRYSKIKREELRDLIAQYEADPDPLNLLPELAAVRALFHDFVDRYEETTAALTRTRKHLLRQHSQWLYFERCLKVYQAGAMYVLKPLEAIHWTRRQAILDAGEIIAETLGTQDE